VRQTHICVHATGTHVDICRNVVGGLPRLLSCVTPSDTLINLLRNEQVQNTIFSQFDDSESWPKVCRTQAPVGYVQQYFSGIQGTHGT
jgi:hypothetical protein